MSININHNFLPTANDKIIAVVHWHDGKKYQVSTKISSSEKALETFVENEKRSILVSAVKSYVSHRQYAIEHSHTKPTQRKVNAISKIRRGMDVYSQAKLDQVVKVILCLENDLLELMPGINSKYHLHYTQIINQLITYCKNVNDGIE